MPEPDGLTQSQRLTNGQPAEQPKNKPPLEGFNKALWSAFAGFAVAFILFAVFTVVFVLATEGANNHKFCQVVTVAAASAKSEQYRTAMSTLGRELGCRT